MLGQVAELYEKLKISEDTINLGSLRVHPTLIFEIRYRQRVK